MKLTPRNLRERTEWLRKDLKNAIRIDIEANALALDDVTEIHCIHTYDPVLDEWGAHRGTSLRLDPLRSYVAHNGIGYDYPLLQRFGVLRGATYLHDTLRYARLFKPSPDPIQGSLHSLKAWGIRLKEHKGDYSGGWDEWSQEMDDYCRQDVVVQDALTNHLVDQDPLWLGIGPAIRERFHRVIDSLEEHGVAVDVDKLQEVYVELQGESSKLEAALQEIIPARVVNMKTPAYYEDPMGNRYRLKGDAPSGVRKSLTPGPMRQVVTPFNPRSSKWITEHLLGLGWEPTRYTSKTRAGGGGAPKTDAQALSEIHRPDWPEVDLLLQFAEVDVLKRSLMPSGASGGGILNKESKGIVRGSVTPSGANTHRCAHFSPNLANVPARSARGLEIRAGFVPRRGHTLCGFDAKGLEMGGLGHYLAEYDGGAWSQMFAEAETAEKYTAGDPHWRTAMAAGFPERQERFQELAGPDGDWRKAARNASKTLFYALVYGAGDAKLGEAGVYSDEELEAGRKSAPQKAAGIARAFREREGRKAPQTYGACGVLGGQLRDSLRAGIDGLDELLDSLKEAMETRGHLVGLDGRPLWGRSEHSWLNLLIQSWGAIVMETATWIAVESIEDAGLVLGKDFYLVLHVHDEMQLDVADEHVDLVRELGLAAFPKAGELLRCKAPVLGDFASGTSWKETH